MLSALGLVFLFLPLLSEPDVTSTTVKLGAGGACVGCHAHPSHACARLSVCLSVPIWQQAAAPLPVACGSCLSKAFPSPPRSSWRFSGKARRAPLTHPRLAGAEGGQGRAGRESRRGEPWQPHAGGNRPRLEFSCPNKLQTAAFQQKAPAALRV